VATVLIYEGKTASSAGAGEAVRPGHRAGRPHTVELVR
jgi:hypothetical protein